MAGCGSSEIRSGSIERKSERGIGSIRTSYESAKRISLSFEPFSPRHAGSFYSLITVLRGQRPDMYIYIYISFPQEHSTFVSASRNAEQTSRVTRFRRVSSRLLRFSYPVPLSNFFFFFFFFSPCTSSSRGIVGETSRVIEDVERRDMHHDPMLMRVQCGTRRPPVIIDAINPTQLA